MSEKYDFIDDDRRETYGRESTYKTSELSHRELQLLQTSLKNNAVAWDNSLGHSAQLFLSLQTNKRGTASYNLVATFLPTAHVNICNLFWKASLTFHSYTYGDALVNFESLWLSKKDMPSLLVEVCQTSLRKSILDLCQLVLYCGPTHVLRILLGENILGKLSFYLCQNVLNVSLMYCISLPWYYKVADTCTTL